MKEYHLFYTPDIETSPLLPADEAVHAVRVLRMKEGDSLLSTDGRGTIFRSTVVEATQKRCSVCIEERTSQPRLHQGTVTLAIAPTKNMDRMEWLAEKATEIGIDRLCFIDVKNSERHVVKTERIEKIVVAAMKQSHKAWKPEVVGMESFEKFIQSNSGGASFIAHCYEDDAKELLFDALIPPPADTTVMVGPEGDFTIQEIKEAAKAGYLPVSLGTSRLRTETAGLVAVHLMNLKDSGMK